MLAQFIIFSRWTNGLKNVLYFVPESHSTTTMHWCHYHPIHFRQPARLWVNRCLVFPFTSFINIIDHSSLCRVFNLWNIFQVCIWHECCFRPKGYFWWLVQAPFSLIPVFKLFLAFLGGAPTLNEVCACFYFKDASGTVCAAPLLSCNITGIELPDRSLITSIMGVLQLL